MMWGGWGYYVLVAQDITCHFSQGHAKVMKIFDFGTYVDKKLVLSFNYLF